MTRLCLRESLKDYIFYTLFLLIISVSFGFLSFMAFSSKEEFWCLSFSFLVGALTIPVLLLEAWKNRTSLEMDDSHILLQRRNYTIELNLHKIKCLMMFKRGKKGAWLFLLQDNKVVRPIDFSSWKYDWTSVKEKLEEIASKNKIPFVFTRDYEEVDALFLCSDAAPNWEEYKVTQKSLFYSLIGGFSAIVLLLSFILQFAVGGLTAFVTLLSLCLLALVILFAYAKDLRTKESFSLRAAGITVEEHPYRWENFSSIQWWYVDTLRGRKLQSCKISIGNEEVDLPSYELNELAEQFSYFSKRFVELQEKKI